VHTALLGERIADWTAEQPGVSAAVTAAAVASAVHAAQSLPVLNRIPTGYRNLRSQPRIRTFTLEGRAEEFAVSYVTTRDGTFLVDGYTVVVPHPLRGREVPPAQALRATLETAEGVRSTYNVTITESTVDVDGSDGSFSFIPVPRFVDPSEAVAEGSLLAPMPAAVTQVAVEAGQVVQKGDVIVVLEAMKMQHTVTAPADGVIAELDVSVGQQVESGAVLAVIDTHPEGDQP
jgi:propionyl-CoA carboxylase alpha chain